MTKIETLVPDIYQLIQNGVEQEEEEHDYKGFGRQSSDVLERGLQPRDGQRAARVWFSNAGHPCHRKLWYKIHTPNRAEPLLPHTRIKFLYGDLLEGLLLDLAVRAGHVVEHEQERVEFNGITGRIDAVIDGVLVDVKSASSYAFKKFEGHLRSEDDAFGYLGQLAGYLQAVRTFGSPFIKTNRVDPSRAAFLAINKETGKLCLDIHEFTDEELETATDRLVRARDAGLGDVTPDRAFEPVPEGKSGNLKLNTNCSYCEFRQFCWPGLRTFLYSNKPVHLVNVEREPNVPELKEELIE